MYTPPSTRSMAIPRAIQPLLRRRRSQAQPERDTAASFHPPSIPLGTPPRNSSHNTRSEVDIIRQQRRGVNREHSRRALANPGIPAIGEESEDDLSMGIPHRKNSGLGNRKRRATEALEDTAARISILDGAASTPSAKRPRTSGSTSSPGYSFTESLALMSPSPKKMEALQYKATFKRRESQRKPTIKRVGEMFSEDGHLSRWLDDLRTSALRRPSQSLRCEIHNTTVRLKKLQIDDAHV